MVLPDVIHKCSKEVLVLVQTTNPTPNNFTTFFQFGPYFVKTYKNKCDSKLENTLVGKSHQLLY